MSQEIKTHMLDDKLQKESTWRVKNVVLGCLNKDLRGPCLERRGSARRRRWMGGKGCTFLQTWDSLRVARFIKHFLWDGAPKRGFTNTSDLGFSLLKLKPGNQKVLNNAMVNKHCNVPLPKELDRISQFLEWVDQEWIIRRSNFGRGSESYVTKHVQALVVEKIFSKRNSVVRMPMPTLPDLTMNLSPGLAFSLF